MGGEIRPKSAFDAQHAEVGSGFEGRADPEDMLVLDVQEDLASHPAVGAGAADFPVRGEHSHLSPGIAPAAGFWIDSKVITAGLSRSASAIRFSASASARASIPRASARPWAAITAA